MGDVDLVALRAVLRTGVLNKNLHNLYTAAVGEGEVVDQIQFLKVIYGQTAHAYNTYAGTMLTQLATLSYLESIKNAPRRPPKAPTSISNSKELAREFSVTSQDTLLARRLLLGRIQIPSVSGMESMSEFVGFEAGKQAEEANRSMQEILRLRKELEDYKAMVAKELNENTTDLKGAIARIQEMFGSGTLVIKKDAKKDTKKDTANTQGPIESESEQSVPELTSRDAVLNYSMNQMEGVEIVEVPEGEGSGEYVEDNSVKWK
jgi:hypothetical protein